MTKNGNVMIVSDKPEKGKRRSSPEEVKLNTIPLLPVRDNVHFPQIVSTLLIGRELSLRALQAAIRNNRLVLVVGQRDVAVEEPKADDIFRVGTLSEVVQVMPMPDGTMRVVLRGLARAKVNSLKFKSGSFTAEYEELDEIEVSGVKSLALRREAVEEAHEIAAMGKQIPIEVLEILGSIEDAGHLADLLADHLAFRPAMKQELLEELSCEKRLEKLIQLLTGEKQVLELQNDLRVRVEEELGNTQREYFLREQLRVIQNELNETRSEFNPENEEIAAKIQASGMPPETTEKAFQELRRLEKYPSHSPETMVVRNYLDWLTALPWSVTSEDRLDVKIASRILDEQHFELRRVKDRILDFLAVRQVSKSLRGPILCFVGPPGVGKTSLGRSIAESLGRKFVRVSVGGIRDEAEIRGHRRTYVGSMPGRIIQGVKQCGTKNPVFMLDEIDKMVMDFRGDPTSALLEALDPEQNEAFSDHYIEAPFDLSGVFFIMTANMIENIPGPLRDRMEIIHFPSYTESEKQQITTQFLIPKKIAEHGLSADQLHIPAESVLQIIQEYTREAGVRNIEREIATLCRKTARKIAENNAQKITINSELIREFLGRPRYRHGSQSAEDEVGAATGLVWTEVGGDLITIECSLMSPFGNEPQVQLTGSLGAVMKESAVAAVTYVRSNQEILNPGKEFKFDVHVHVPEGAVPKDGPSAGVTLVTALVSAFTGKPVRREIAMTGEITLRGKVLPVGGIREKVLAAHRAGIYEVILPEECLNDLEDIPEAARSQMTFHGVKHISEVLDLAFRR